MTEGILVNKPVQKQWSMGYYRMLNLRKFLTLKQISKKGTKSLTWIVLIAVIWHLLGGFDLDVNSFLRLSHL